MGIVFRDGRRLKIQMGFLIYLNGLRTMKHPVILLVWIFIGAMFFLAVLKLVEGKLQLAGIFAVMGIVVALLLNGSLYLSDWMLRKSEPATEALPVVAPPPREVTPPESPIEMRHSWETIMRRNLLYAAGFLFVGIWLLGYPQTLWTRWLAYPAALILLTLAGIVLYAASCQKKERIVADREGIEIRTGGEAPKKVHWNRVGTVKILEVRTRTKPDSPVTRVSGSYLLLQDREGIELLKVEEPLVPSEAYRLLLDCLPAWTGFPVQREKQTRG